MISTVPYVEAEPQMPFFAPGELPVARSPFRAQLLKWIGNKQKFADAILAYFPKRYETYFEPFLGSGGVLGVLAPKCAIASDCFAPLVEIWQTLSRDQEELKRQYAVRHALMQQLGKQAAYDSVLARYNQKPNGADLVFLCRSCYGGVVRFRKADGHMSTPVGIHEPISPESFSRRVDLWAERTRGTQFLLADFADSMRMAQSGDMVYCDPPYLDSQTILYGAQEFSALRLFEEIARCKQRGVRVALSIDGTKQSGKKLCDVPFPPGLFEREVFLALGRSMLKRFQMNGKTLEHHKVEDRLLLTY